MNDEVKSGSLYNKMMSKICIVPRVEGSGGMASFRLKFEQGIKFRGMDVTHDLSEKSDAVLVIAGTRNLWQLYQARKRGVRIVQRLDGRQDAHPAHGAVVCADRVARDASAMGQ